MVRSAPPDERRAFYTTSPALVSHMVRMLDVGPGHNVLEPCAGNGAFVQAVREHEPDAKIDAWELDAGAVEVLRRRWGGGDAAVRVFQADTLIAGELDTRRSKVGGYDRVIGNPPYGGWQDPERRALLKKTYPGQYVKETYGLFLLRALSMLKPGGRLVFIVPDTFLSIHRHRPLRQVLLKQSIIERLDLFPSSFFPDVSFGYARLAIVTLVRTRDPGNALANEVLVFDGFESAEALAERRQPSARLRQSSVHDSPSHAFLIAPADVRASIQNATNRVEDLAMCVTGFYSGDDKRFLRTVDRSSARRARYETVEAEHVCWEPQAQPDVLNGLTGARSFVPIMKGGNRMYHKPTEWFMDWSAEAVAHYRTSQRARFQNAQYYFRDGVGVPMVSGGRITAARIGQRLFDQSIVGVFPLDPDHLEYLLAFFNSRACNRLVQALNPTANNSANYLKKIPLARPSSQELANVRDRARRIAARVQTEGQVPSDLQDELDALFDSQYGFGSPAA